MQNLDEQNKCEVSIIVLSVNQAKLTNRCFASIKKYTKIPYEVIWVDNGSNESEFQHIYEYIMKSNLPTKLLRFNENKGFVGGVNAAIPFISKDSSYVVLLNNDTEIGPDTFQKMLIPLLNKKIGASGCITQSSMAWQSYENISKLWKLKFPRYVSTIENYTRELEKKYPGKCINIGDIPLSFFCVAFRKEVFCNELGGLDKDIDIGFGDDDIACKALRRLKYINVVCLDAFVYHHHRTTFRALGINIDDLHRKNLRVVRIKNRDA
jgi:GT2 family glycosyltransferase